MKQPSVQQARKEGRDSFHDISQILNEMDSKLYWILRPLDKLFDLNLLLNPYGKFRARSLL